MIESLENAKKEGEYLAKGQFATRKHSLELSEKQIDEILEKLSLMFAKKGIDNDGEPNGTDLYIENLIAIFNTKN